STFLSHTTLHRDRSAMPRNLCSRRSKQTPRCTFRNESTGRDTGTRARTASWHRSTHILQAASCCASCRQS
ncbi:hypothetical protein LPJ57_011252, partial [Coemansia sp. RSA 486]